MTSDASPGRRILIDACVLYPTVLREVLTGCAERGLFVPLWSERILEEWARATVKLGEAAHLLARGEVAALAARFPQAMVRVPQGMAERLWLPDPDDTHVLAAAIAGRAEAILTLNAADFPKGVLAGEGLVRLDPDNFLLGLLEVAPEAVGAVVTAVAAEATRLSGEDWTPQRLMKKARLHRFARALGRR
ncbi:MAG: PIN domain-containing protein [Rubellimicrobium sp.]|nr:PIN domain-containing protein [Rubellimicrobium sp.]